MEFKKVLIANRGEIALRIIKTLRQMNIGSIALYTGVEAGDLHVKAADEACPLGNGSLSQTWLNIPLIIAIARESGADAIHPGYGFLSENDAFAKACEEAGIVFIGPSSKVIAMMGSKISASAYARKAGIPLLPRMEDSVDTLIEKGAQLGFPLLVKAAAGGGGKGMIRVDSADMLAEAVLSAAQQAKRYFDDEKIFLEKYLTTPRHIEVQVLADHHGNVIHLHERECTLQRNHQKVIEEAPSVSLSASVRAAMHKAAVELTKKVGYHNAGTIEFIVDSEGKFYFLEMNTRIQVEHPVTEMITGIDIVKEQLLIAMGDTLSFSQTEVNVNGHAIEARLYAEDPQQGFKPSAGNVQQLVLPRGRNIRTDSAIDTSGKVHASFDAMITKIISFAPDRKQAIQTMDTALKSVLVHGITSNIHLLSNIIQDDLYQSNRISTHTIAENIDRWAIKPLNNDHQAIAAAMLLWLERYSTYTGNGAWRMAGTEKILINKQETEVFYYPMGDTGLKITIEGNTYIMENIFMEGNKISFLWNNTSNSVVVSYSAGDAMVLMAGIHYHVMIPQTLSRPKINIQAKASKFSDIKASLFGRVLRVNVSEKQKVKLGDSLMIIESMKMENAVLAPADNTISTINVKEGDQVSDGQILICFEP